MKKIFILFMGVLLLALGYRILKLGTDFKANKYDKSVGTIEVSLESSKNKTVANYYKEGFDFNYGALAAIHTLDNEDTLIFNLIDNDAKRLIVGEDYYKYYEDNSGTTERETYTIYPTDKGKFEMQVKRRENVKDEKAIYYIKYDESDKGVFVFQVDFLIGG